MAKMSGGVDAVIDAIITFAAIKGEEQIRIIAFSSPFVSGPKNCDTT